MACFICKCNGHWARNCPAATCQFCGEKGHNAAACSLQTSFKNLATEPILQEIPISRTRTRKVSTKTLDEILFANHLAPQSNMKQDVDSFIKTNFSHNGIIDEYAIGEKIFTNVVCNSHDVGHMKVLGYIIAKYCDVSQPPVKEFLRRLAAEFKELDDFRHVLYTFGTTFYLKNDAMHFRKMSGFTC